MVLTPKMAEFHKLREGLDQIAAEQGGISPNQVESFLQDKGVDLKEFQGAWKEFKDTGYELDRPGFLLGRIAGRAVGETAKALAPESLENWTEQKIAKNLPEGVRRSMSELFDPYHGDGFIEPLAAELASLAIPYTGLMKGYKYGKSFISEKNLSRLGLLDKPQKIVKAKRLTPRILGSVQEQVLKPHRKGKGKGVWAKRERLKKRGKGLVREGLGFSGAVTIINGPEEDWLTDLIAEYPETMGMFQGLAIDPKDPKLLQELNAFLNNTILEAPFALGGGAAIYFGPKLAEAARRIGLSKTIVEKTKLDKVAKRSKEWLTSKYGVDDVVLSLGLRRFFAPNKAISEADGIAQDFKRIVKEESAAARKNKKPIGEDELLKRMNRALGGESYSTPDYNRRAQEAAMTTLRATGYNKTADLLEGMRVHLDEFSKSLTDVNGNDLVTGDLKVTIDSNLGFYMNRAYRLFDDPSFKGWDELDDSIKANAMNYMNEQGINNLDAEWVLKQILARGRTEKDFKNGIKLLAKTFTDGNKPFLRRGGVPWQIRDLMQEIKDPYKNFARTYEKLSIAKAEADFMHDIRKHLLNHELAVIGEPSKYGYRLTQQAGRPKNTTNEEALINLKDISQERLKKILGQSNVNPTQPSPLTGKIEPRVVNPLEDLFVNESYAKFLNEGIEYLSPINATWQKFLMLKVASQTAKTVLSPATHGRNIMGNVILMVANGYKPYALGGEQNPFAIVANLLTGYSDEQLGKYVGRLQELGIIDSSVKAQTLKKNASEVFNFDPGTRMEQLSRSKAGKVVGKTFELYQAEDDLFKMLHFQKTMDDMRKWNLGVTDDVLEEMAAARTRDLMPNYALVPKAVKMLRRWPLSDFAAWPSEMMRVSKNLLKYTYDDVTGKTAKKLRDKGFDINAEAAEAIRDQGYRRMGGLVSASMAGDVAQNYSMNIAGLSQEDVYNINRLSPPWSQDTAKIFLSPLNMDENKHFGIDFVNLGPIDPFSYLKAPARMLVSHLKSGKNLERPDINAMLLSGYSNVVEPFLGLSMASEAMMNIMQGAGTREGLEEASKDIPGFGLRMAKEVYDLLEPGALNLFMRQLDYNRRKGAGVTEGAQSKFGYTMPHREFFDPLGEEGRGQSGALLRWIGIRPQRLDISAGMRRTLLPLIKNIDNATAEFTNNISDPRGMPQEKIFDFYRKAVMKQLEQYQELNSYTEIYDDLLKDAHLTESNRNALIRKGITKDFSLKLNANLIPYMDRTRRNIFYPFNPTKAAQNVSRRYTNVPIPWEKIRRYQKAMSGTKITNK